MDCSTPGLPAHHQLPEFTQTHVHWVGDDIQPSHPLSSPSPPAFSLSQHQGLCHRVSSPHQGLARRNTDKRIWVAPRCPLLLSACTLSPPSHEQHWPLIHVPNKHLFNFMCAFINLIIRKYFKLHKRFLGSRDEMNKTRFLLGFPW